MEIILVLIYLMLDDDPKLMDHILYLGLILIGFFLCYYLIQR